jgi:hypothetical protein
MNTAKLNFSTATAQGNGNLGSGEQASRMSRRTYRRTAWRLLFGGKRNREMDGGVGGARRRRRWRARRRRGAPSLPSPSTDARRSPIGCRGCGVTGSSRARDGPGVDRQRDHFPKIVLAMSLGGPIIGAMENATFSSCFSLSEVQRLNSATAVFNCRNPKSPQESMN